MTEKEESLIQLVLTQDEAMLLGSVCTLGTRVLRSDKEGAILTCTLLTAAIDIHPKAMDSLITKMLALSKVGIKYAEGKLDETKVADN